MPDPVQSVTGNYNTVVYGEGASAIVNIGLTAEEIALLLQAAGAAAQAQITELSSQLNVSRGVVLGFLSTLREDAVSIENLPAKLNEIANRYLGLMDRLSALDSEDVVARGLIEEAHQVLLNASSAKDYDRAESLLQQASSSQWQSIRRIEEFEHEAHEAARRLRWANAATLAELAELSLTRLDYWQAAQHLRAAADLLAPEDANERRDYLLRSASALDDYGDEKGSNAVLAQAIDRYKDLLRETQRAKVPLEWARAQNGLAVSLTKLGERESGTARLEEAVAVCRAALEERTRERGPLEWATTQNNLGGALLILGARESGTVRLEQAAAALRDALKERTREHVPLDWAMTQNNLGVALLMLGVRESGAKRLEEAMTVFRSTIMEYSRERLPLRWATTQNNLGQVLSTLGVRESGTLRLVEAVAAYRAALQEWTRERVPLDWARTQDNLGIALWAIGKRENGTARLEEARSAIAAAWNVYQQAGMTHYDGYFTRHIAEIERLIAERSTVQA